ncbi:DHA2 family efflux MFS transporter permease subunit [Lentibacillus sp. CBA3610]|uniref:DHA2 family efflux MFS transporter permease subunit n=1 Tax=Lentibacillus sp. CBA3610 TaxID=2518176 RepID=UPI00159533EB|nr:DHA2 family efflux MFS transporter permease subunit [Lentibacillus sp. CBA3610]QKY70158.1 DHA2 family efflux MFS transporter permease subunit [Lentibacillus sp. CBA3610]
MHLSRLHRRLIVAITLSASFLSVLTQFLLITAFPKIMDEFGINSTEVQWLTTVYMLTIAVLIPITAYFIDTLKTRHLMMSAMFLFVTGTLICLVAPTFPILLMGRIFQGMGSGIMIPLMQTILFLMYPREKRGFAMGLAGLVINVAPAVGPPISGVITNYFDWRALFVLTLAVAAGILLLIFLFMQNVTEQRETNIDFSSILLSTVGFGGILYAFNKMEQSGIGDPAALVSMIAGAVALALFVIRQLRLQTPILEVRVLKAPVFALVAIISILSFSLLISIETMLPMYVQNAQQYSAFFGGLIVMPGALTLAIMSLFAGNLFDKYGGKIIAITGFVLLCLSTLGFHFILGLETPFAVTMALFMVAMGGVALINMPIMTAGINVLPDNLIPHGTAVINTARQFGGSLGLTFIISFISGVQSGSETIDPANYLVGVKTAFFVAFLFAATGLVLSLFLKRDKQPGRQGHGV